MFTEIEYNNKCQGNKPEQNNRKEYEQIMNKIDFSTVAMVRTYKNNGQHLEQKFRFYLTGEIVKADNVAHDKGTDLFNYSIKSARATVCIGTDLTAYLDTDKATEFVYITATEIAYIMSRKEYETFVEVFGTLDHESGSKKKKIRLGHESQKMLRWLERACH